MTLSLLSMNRERPSHEVALALLLALYSLFSLHRMRGALSLEAHIDDQRRSSVFHYHSEIRECPWLMEPLTDVFRLVTLGVDDHEAIDATLRGVMEAEERDVALLLRKRGLALPMVAAVWTIAFIALGWRAAPLMPISGLAIVSLLHVIAMHQYRRIADHRIGLLRALRQAMVHHAKGNAPTVSVEMARQALPVALRPGFRAFDAAMLTASARSLDHRLSVLPAEEIPEDGDYDRAMRDLLARTTEPDRPSAVLSVMRDISGEIPSDLTWAYQAFGELSHLNAMSVQTLLRNCDKSILVKALLGAPGNTVIHFFDQISSRASRLLREDMAACRSLPVPEIVKAQRAVVEQAAELMQRGEIEVLPSVLESSEQQSHTARTPG
ncbi:MAG: FliG C-terminal domain-containing protein [Rhodospirillaceae bacterium]